MISLQIISMKNFIYHLLVLDTFDCFLLEESTIATANTYHVNGAINKEFYKSVNEDLLEQIPYEYSSWKEKKEFIYQLLKGKNTPIFFKIVLQLKPEIMNALLQNEDCKLTSEQIKALILTIKYDGTLAILTNGIAYHTFIMSKEPEIIWDKYLSKYLSQKGVTFDELF